MAPHSRFSSHTDDGCQPYGNGTSSQTPALHFVAYFALRHHALAFSPSASFYIRCLTNVPSVLWQLNESDFRPLVVTDDSSVILNQLHVDEQGTYRCSLQGNETIFYQVTFLLNGTVTALTHHHRYHTQIIRLFRKVIVCSD